MDAKYLAEIKAREQVATPGPWEEKTNRHPQCNGEPWGWISGAAGNITWSGYVGKTNADFIAHARTDIPALISEVERLNVIAEQRYQLYDGALTTIATLEKALELASKFIVEYGRVDQFLCDDIPDPIHLKHQPKNNGDYANRPCIKCVQEYFTLLGAVE